MGKTPIFNFIAAVSDLLLNFKFLLFFRVIQSFGIYFAIIIGVARKVFSFLMILLHILIGFAQAFYILLRTTTVNSGETTNMFSWFPTALLAMYSFLTGNNFASLL